MVTPGLRAEDLTAAVSGIDVIASISAETLSTAHSSNLAFDSTACKTNPPGG
jgi:hypothetical protein